MKLLLLFGVLLSAAVFINSCTKEKNLARYTENISCTEPDDFQNTYSGKIATILSGNCAIKGCHDAATQEQGRDFSTYTSAKDNFDASALCAIYYDKACEPMPRNAPRLSADNIHDLTCWVKNGYPQ